MSHVATVSVVFSFIFFCDRKRELKAHWLQKITKILLQPFKYNFFQYLKSWLTHMKEIWIKVVKGFSGSKLPDLVLV